MGTARRRTAGRPTESGGRCAQRRPAWPSSRGRAASTQARNSSGWADTLGAPIAKAFLGKSVLPDDHPLTTGGIGHLGTAPSSWAMHNCDTVLILGSTMPWIDYYPKPGQARGVQIDLRPDRIGLRYPVEVGLTGDIKTTLEALQPFLRPQADQSFLTAAQDRMRSWRRCWPRWPRPKKDRSCARRRPCKP